MHEASVQFYRTQLGLRPLLAFGVIVPQAEFLALPHFFLIDFPDLTSFPESHTLLEIRGNKVL